MPSFAAPTYACPQVGGCPPHIREALISCWTYQNEAAARAWIDAFFFRASAMVPQNEMMVLSVGQQIPPTAAKQPSSTVSHRVIDYIAATADKSMAGKIVARLACLSFAQLTSYR